MSVLYARVESPPLRFHEKETLSQHTSLYDCNSLSLRYHAQPRILKQRRPVKECIRFGIETTTTLVGIVTENNGRQKRYRSRRGYLTSRAKEGTGERDATTKYHETTMTATTL